MVEDFDSAWPTERRRRYELALAYHRTVFANEGIDALTWLERHRTAMALGDLPSLFALVHRDVAPLDVATWRRHRGPRPFPPNRRLSGMRCESLLVWGYTCPLGATSAELELDHGWPHALGGRSEPSNGVWLCKLHNRAKSHDVHNYEWPQDAPSWLTMFLAWIKRECEAQLR